MSFPTGIKDKVCLASGRRCAICKKFCGKNIEVHHIIPQSKGEENSEDNAIPLCFDCHSDMGYDSSHPKGKKYSETELRNHRDKLYSEVKNNQIPNTDNTREIDVAVYKRFLNLLPIHGGIDLIANQNFEGIPFDTNILNDFDNFSDNFKKDPSFEFIDDELEIIRKSIFDDIQILDNILSLNSFPMNSSSNRSRIPPEWRYEYPQKFKDIVNEIHMLADRIKSNHSALMRKAIRKLNITP